VALFEADRVTQSGHRLLEILVTTAREAASAASASAMTLSFSCAASALRRPAFSSRATSSLCCRQPRQVARDNPDWDPRGARAS
jgi:hypothetical protein